LVARQFDLRQEARELELERLRKQLTEVEQTIGRHKALKEKVVDRRVTDLLDETTELKWEPLAGAGGGTRLVYEEVVEDQALPDGSHAKVKRMVARVVPDGQLPVPPSSSYLPPAAPTATPPSTPAPGVLPGGMVPPGSGISRGGMGMTGPVAVDQLPTERAGMSPLNATAGKLALLQAAQRLEVARQELARTEELCKKGIVSIETQDAKRADVDLQQLGFERAKQEYEGQSKLLELNLRAAEVELGAAEQRLKVAPDRPQAELEVQRAKIQVERAKALLQLHTSGTAQDGASTAQPAQVGASTNGSAAAASGTKARSASGEQANDRTESMNHLKQIGLAIHNYFDVNRTCPPAYRAENSGRPLLSWRVLILPYLEQEALYRQFHLDEPWDSEHNKQLIECIPTVYRSPGSKAALGITNYLTVRGPNTIFPGKDAISFQDVTDGSCNTLMVVEVSDQKAVVWTKPDDFEYNESDPLAGLVGLRSEGFLAALCDRAVLLIPSSVEKETLRRLFVRNDGKPVPSSIGKAD
jgi:uncharacterized lipoprotein NlpE involved in copper resistance